METEAATTPCKRLNFAMSCNKFQTVLDHSRDELLISHLNIPCISNISHLKNKLPFSIRHIFSLLYNFRCHTVSLNTQLSIQTHATSSLQCSKSWEFARAMFRSNTRNLPAKMFQKSTQPPCRWYGGSTRWGGGTRRELRNVFFHLRQGQLTFG